MECRAFTAARATKARRSLVVVAAHSAEELNKKFGECPDVLSACGSRTHAQTAALCQASEALLS